MQRAFQAVQCSVRAMTSAVSGMMSQAQVATYATKTPVMGRAKRGLFGGKDVMTGNNVSFSNRKTRRTWKPNVQTKAFFSDTLQRRITFRVTTYAMRCIDKAGGIDNYLVKTKDEELFYDRALQLKKVIKEKRATESSN
eukprot:CAMPEP_0113867550 /NCGR_PEP_ID=MMETSP0780_2-20120614/483_1 /TAXON_ID=652834 /ORGANISM="Palpitomonas bilix" /LENGTH=138 /DNA_ID=CAMNT_0000852509 /DNA_START=77 /DNA_END=493 /DNA_ORIENTATION=+ /assembly_acc=CAM_ASM_000599